MSEVLLKPSLLTTGHEAAENFGVLSSPFQIFLILT